MKSRNTEQHRNECEARYVLSMPTIDERRSYLTLVQKRRNEQARKHLEAEIIRQHRLRRQAA